MKKQFQDAVKNGIASITKNGIASITKKGRKANLEEIRRGLQRFKMDMMKELPFYGDILMRVEVREDSEIETAQTNGKSISYNPDFFAELSEGQRNYVLLHEVLHILLLHWKRQAGRNRELWNIACDYVVNGIIDHKICTYNILGWIKIERPPYGCFVKGYYHGEPAEQFYKELYGKLKNKIKALTDRGEGNGGILKVNGMYAVEIDKVHVRTPADLAEAQEQSESEVAEAETFIKELVKDTIKRRGTAGCYIPEQIVKLTESKKLPWNKLLYEFLEEKVDEESSYLTPERKYIHMDLIIPGLSKTEDELGEIWAFVDTSGSIAGNELDQFMTQLYRIAKEFRCIFNIAFWDTKVSDVFENVTNKEDVLKCRPRHSGGTDIDCVYDYIREEKPKIGVMLILTDGYFGRLHGENIEAAGKLSRKTILVISEKGTDPVDKEKYGKIARL
ncbi:MAG: VWA-like domain-containing protein [Lachnospiraceae bacterium]|nr:VWA-like domain-containing protein [Lachnospiraceae bacterium]